MPGVIRRVFVPKNRAYFVLQVLNISSDAEAVDRNGKIHSIPAHPSPPPVPRQQQKAHQPTRDADASTVGDKSERASDISVPCFGIAGSTFVSHGTTMDAELYATYLPNITNIAAGTPHDGTLSTAVL